jgi:hypothetical protein
MEQLILPLDEFLAEDFERLFTDREHKRRQLDRHIEWLLQSNAERERWEHLVTCAQIPLPWPAYVLYTSDGKLHDTQSILSRSANLRAKR